MYGRINDVTSADIRAAIKECDRFEKPIAIEVASKTEMHAYFKERNLGWVSVRWVPFRESDDRSHPLWNYEYSNIILLPEAFRIIRNASCSLCLPGTL